MQVGDLMDWHKTVSNYGHVSVYRVRVKKIGKRVTVDQLDKQGNAVRTTVVRAEHLRDVPLASG